MKEEIVIWEQNPALVKTLKQTVFPNASGEELALYFHQCRRTGVHPLDGLIHPVKRGSQGETRVSFQASIDYLRSVAEDSGEYDGQDEPEYEGMVDDKYPELARVKVYRKGIERPFVGIARWLEYYPGDKLGFMWRKMPHNQLAKCAEALALRKAFPQKLHGLYIGEEMAQADMVNSEVVVGKKEPPTVTRKSQSGGQQEGNGKIQPAQLRAIYPMLKKLGVTEDQKHVFCAKALGIKGLKSLNDLTPEQGKELIQKLMSSEPAIEPEPTTGELMDEVTPDDIRDIFTGAGYAEDQILSKIGTILQEPPKKAIEDYSDQALKDVAAWMGENEGC